MAKPKRGRGKPPSENPKLRREGTSLTESEKVKLEEMALAATQKAGTTISKAAILRIAFRKYAGLDK